jgi:hypothetical protein
MIEMKYYSLSSIDRSEIKDKMIDSIAILKQNALLINFNDKNMRKKYEEQVRNVQRYFTVLELMVNEE